MASVASLQDGEENVSSTNADNYDTGVVSPASNELILLFSYSEGTGSSTAVEPTITGGGMTTWNQLATSLLGTNIRASVSWALQVSPGSAAINIDFDGNSQRNCGWAVVKVTNVPTSNAIVQSATAQPGGSGTSNPVTLASFGDSTNNIVVAIQAHGEDANALTLDGTPSGYAELSQNNTGEGNRAQVSWNTGEDLSVDATYSSSGSRRAIAIEIDNDEGGAAATRPNRQAVAVRPMMRM